VRLLTIKEQFSENSAKAVFFGRFFALLRVFSAPLAGIVEMPFGKFLICNLAGSVIWASLMVTLAFFAGKVISLDQLIAWMSKFAFLALIILGCLIGIPIWWESRQIKNIGTEE
jgi:membrane protein DedA with SNARE-associated domain